MGILDKDFHRKAQEVIKEWNDKFGYAPGKRSVDGLLIWIIILIVLGPIILGMILWYLDYNFPPP
ncbi:MAG: hypothetical protein A3J76_03030 [Candidatus Moranbacteria bacterium RBG_13_45_13]|nr:MAG: hypothetical protein A3J76_03030 [Candidatus Moranbacteria bacterium RBG_13_45_13]